MRLKILVSGRIVGCPAFLLSDAQMPTSSGTGFFVQFGRDGYANQCARGGWM